MDESVVTALNAIVTGYTRESVTLTDIGKIGRFTNSVATVAGESFKHNEDAVFALLTAAMLMMVPKDEISEGGLHDRRDIPQAIQECADFFAAHFTFAAESPN